MKRTPLLRHTWMPRKRLTPRRTGTKTIRVKVGRQEDPAYLERLRRFGCYCCRIDGLGWHWAEPHHPRPGGLHGPGAGQKSDDRDAIPLCPRHHREKHPDSLSIHMDAKAFRARYGTEAEIRDCVLALLEIGESA